MRNGATNLGVMITLGSLLLSAVVGTVTEMVTTRSIAVQAASDSKQALENEVKNAKDDAENAKAIASLVTNVEWIKNALKDNGTRPRYELLATTTNAYTGTR